MPDAQPVTADLQMISRQCDAIASYCSAISFGGSIGENTAAIMASLDVIQHAALAIVR